MKKLLILLLLIGCNGSRDLASENNLFSSVLIVGASVSANWYQVDSPGLRIAKAYESKYDKVAQGGKNSFIILKDKENIVDANHSIIFGLDLFFWDSVNTNCEFGKKQINNFLKRFSFDGAPLIILGNIPPLVGRMYCRVELNTFLKKSCGHQENCKLFDFDSLVHGLKKTDKQKYFHKDAIHLTNEGSKFAAKKILEFLKIEDHPKVP
jgi:hypothetical protein